MQTRDAVESLYHCREFSKPLQCLYQVMQTQEKGSLLLLQNNFLQKLQRWQRLKKIILLIKTYLPTTLI